MKGDPFLFQSVLLCFSVLRPLLKMCISAVFSFPFLHQMSRVCVCQQHCCLSPFPSEVFGQLWRAVCITEVVTLTSCLIPGSFSLIDGQSKHCGLQRSGFARACASVFLAVNKYPRLIPIWSCTYNCLFMHGGCCFPNTQMCPHGLFGFVLCKILC